MADTIGTAIIDLILDKSSYEAGLKGVESSAVNASKKITESFTSAGANIAQISNTIGATFQRLAVYAGLAFGVGSIVSFIRESTLLAARIETLNISMVKMGANAGYTSAQMIEFRDGIKKQGIATEEATNSVIRMAQANIPLAAAAKLARVAQDAAVVGNINSSEAFQRMIIGIQRGETLILRNIGINVSMEKAYEKYGSTINKTGRELNQMERAQAVTNAVLEEGAKLAGIYEAAMTTAGKQMNSTKRYVDDVKESIGNAFGPFSLD